MHNTAAQTAATHEKAIRKPIVTKHDFSRLTDGEVHPVTLKKGVSLKKS